MITNFELLFMVVSFTLLAFCVTLAALLQRTIDRQKVLTTAVAKLMER